MEIRRTQDHGVIARVFVRFDKLRERLEQIRLKLAMKGLRLRLTWRRFLKAKRLR
jgi:hypothetical protein